MGLEEFNLRKIGLISTHANNILKTLDSDSILIEYSKRDQLNTQLIEHLDEVDRLIKQLSKI